MTKSKKVKVIMETTIASPDLNAGTGDTVLVDKSQAAALVDGGFAEYVEADQKKEKPEPKTKDSKKSAQKKASTKKAS